MTLELSRLAGRLVTTLTPHSSAELLASFLHVTLLHIAFFGSLFLCLNKLACEKSNKKHA